MSPHKQLEQGGHSLSRLLVGLGQEVRVRREHCIGIIAQPGGQDVHRYPFGERKRRGRVPEHVECSCRQAS